MRARDVGELSRWSGRCGQQSGLDRTANLVQSTGPSHALSNAQTVRGARCVTLSVAP